MAKLELMNGDAPKGLSFARIFAHVPTQLMVMDRNLVIVFANESYLQTTGRCLSEIRNRYVFDAFPEAPERVAVFKDAFERALAGEPNVLRTEPFSVPLADGSMKEVVWTCSHTPIEDDDGAIAYVLQNAVDVTHEHALNDHNQMLVKELNHRVKNALATVAAIARQSFVEAKSLDDAREDFIGRVHALADVQDILMDRTTGRAELRTVLERTLRPFGIERRNPQRIFLEGPSTSLLPKQAQMMSMGVHELATNAAKYGALSQEGGLIRISWTHDPKSDGAFTLTWSEEGGPKVAKPARRGFGTIMLTGILAMEITGKIAVDYARDGIICRMEGRLPVHA